MSETPQDDLWPHFSPLWPDLRRIAPDLLLAGGYGLFLKQQWLISQQDFPGTKTGDFITDPKGGRIVLKEIRTLIPIRRWLEQSPRVTKDFDLIVSADIIASAEDQQSLHKLLESHNFAVVPENAQWQFAKRIGENRQVVLDFHTPSPPDAREDLRVQSRRVKPRPSLGQIGVHGRENPEAIGSELHPFAFMLDGLELAVPNPVTFTMMKLAALHDRWSASQDISQSAENRERQSDQARKHAQDIFRIVAMMTREENEKADEILKAVRGCTAYPSAATAVSQFFKSNDGWGSQAVRQRWQPDDFMAIQNTLAAWFA
jgi:hypothetical protein